MGSFASFSEKTEVFFRFSVPYLLIASLFIFSLIAVVYPLGVSTKTPFFLMGVFYWAVYRPTLMTPAIVFCAGCITDLLVGFPVGLTALCYIFIQWVVTDQRRFLMGQNFIIIWFCFCLLNLASLLFQWAVLSALNTDWLSLNALWLPSVLGSIVFPVVYMLLHMTHKVLPSSSPAGRAF